MEIIFKKIARYKYRADNAETDFMFASRILSQQISPDTQEPDSLAFDRSVCTVYTSSLMRAMRCIRQDQQQEIIATPLLDEIPFEIKKYISEEEYATDGSRAVRRAFVEAFLSDNLLLSRDEIFRQASLLFENMRRCKVDKIGVVSHSFRMKILQAYIATGGKIKNNPELIHDYIKYYDRTFNFKEGFEVTIFD